MFTELFVFFRTRFYLCIVSLRANTITCHPKGCGLKQISTIVDQNNNLD